MIESKRFIAGYLCLVLLSLAITVYAVDLNPQAVEIKRPQDIQWVRNKEGTSERAILFGDPDKTGPYVIQIKWLPGNFSRPHFHNSDRFFTVIKDTWWIGTGNKFDPDNAVAAPAGSYVLHRGGEVHYDGAKNEEAIIQVVGFGPVTTTAAETK
ncbi:MAG: cupin domain-containing protein [Spongiibacteraceae bacterium]